MSQSLSAHQAHRSHLFQKPDLRSRATHRLINQVFPRTGLRRWLSAFAMTGLGLATASATAQGFDKVNTTVTNVNAILVTISVAVVTIAIIWAGFKMIFQGARLADVANVLLGGTLVGGAAAFAGYIVG